jgi:hypothetical protein
MADDRRGGAAFELGFDRLGYAPPPSEMNTLNWCAEARCGRDNRSRRPGAGRHANLLGEHDVRVAVIGAAPARPSHA